MRREAGTITRLVFGVVLISMVAWGGVLPQVAPAFADASNGVQVSIDAVDEVAPETDFIVNVDITQVTDFDACNYDVSFDPAVLRLDSVTSGNISGTIIPIEVWNEIGPGRYTIIQNVPGLSGISGSGYLAVLHFHVIGSHEQGSEISLSNGMLSSNLAAGILATWSGGLVQVVSVESGGQGVPSAPTSPTETTNTEPEAAAAEPETTATESEITATEPGVTATDPEVEAEGKELPSVAASSSPEAGTTEALDVASASSPPPPPAPSRYVNWSLLWGSIGGAVIVIGLFILFQVRRRFY
ncbi:cohesin domain-containing protein [Chloroflexota bacterium]